MGGIEGNENEKTETERRAPSPGGSVEQINKGKSDLCGSIEFPMCSDDPEHDQ